MVAEIAVRYVNSEVLRGGLGARIYERAPEQCRDHKPSPVKEIWHCCKVSDEAAFCLIQRPYISKTLLT
ncbi:hypothetical protein ACR2WT_25475, partial [Klebsiella pneumoniae]